MATTTIEVPALTISIDQYLSNFSYEPDVEFVDGELRERLMVRSAHGSLQIILGAFLQP